MGQPLSQPLPPGTIEEDLPPLPQDGSYPSGEQHAATLLTVAGEMHLVQGGPNFLHSPSTSRRPTRPPLHAQSLAPAVITAVRSAFPNVGYMEYKELASEIMELVNNRKKESRQCLAQQEHWIEGLQNHIRELYAHIEAARCAVQEVATCLKIQGLPPSNPIPEPLPIVEPLGPYQLTVDTPAASSATAPLSLVTPLSGRGCPL